MIDKPNLIITSEFHAETVAKLDMLYNTHHLWKYSGLEKLELLKSLGGSCQAIATASWINDDSIYQLNSLKLIACFGVGVDAIDFALAESRKIRVSNTPDVLNDSVADIALSLILATSRNIVNADSFVRKQGWHNGPFPFRHSLKGKTLGIIGLGRIGEAIVERALPFKLKIAYHNRSRKDLPYRYYSSIAELATNSDILLCMLPGGEKTRNVIDEAVFEALGQEGIFINVGRGTSVDESALARALKSKQIAGAGLDVYANEPCVPEALIEEENIVLLPHIGSSVFETRTEMGNLLIKNLEAFFANRPLISEVR